MFGRQVAARLRIPAHTRLARNVLFQCQRDLPVRGAAVGGRRLYATPGRARSVVGEPSSTVKRSVKREAKKPASDDDAAVKKTKEKKSAAAAKKKTATKTTKKVAAKAKPKPKRKVLTEAQKAVKAKKLANLEVKLLKEAALSPPPLARASAYLVFFKQQMPDQIASNHDPEGKTAPIGPAVRKVAAEWKDKTPAELEHYNHLARTEKEAADAKYNDWVLSHTPEQIQLANKARRTLRKRLSLPRSAKWATINDERAVKRPMSPFIHFSIERQASGDFANIVVKDRAKLIGQEWKSLDEADKKKYITIYREDHQRFTSEYQDVYGQSPPTPTSSTYLEEPQAASAGA